VNADLSIHRMAFREADSLAVAQALVAKKRVELELTLARERLDMDAALQRMSDETQRSSGLQLDRTV
jgi:hypothetical protein